MCCYNLFPEETECVCDYTGERTWELSPDYPWPLLYASLPLLTALYPFTVTNLSCEYDHMLSPMSSNEPPSLEVVLVPDTPGNQSILVHRDLPPLLLQVHSAPHVHVSPPTTA